MPASWNSCFHGGRSSARRNAFLPHCSLSLSLSLSLKEFRVPPLLQHLPAEEAFGCRSATAAPENRCSLRKERPLREQSPATGSRHRSHPSEKTCREVRVR